MGYVWTQLVPEAAMNTLWLMIVVSIVSGFLGVGLAFLVSYFDFPFRNLVCQLIPMGLAIPGYIHAFLFIDMFDYPGPVQTQLRSWGVLEGFSVREFSGLAWVFVLALTPYVYLLARLGFEKQGRRLKEVCGSLGVGGMATAFQVLLPANWPWILSGLVIVNMEILSDFGTVSAFQYSTFTYVIYESWFGLYQWDVASGLSLAVCSLVLLFLFFKEVLSSKKAYFSSVAQDSKGLRSPLTGFFGLGASSLTMLFLLTSVFIPVFRLMFHSLRTEHDFSQIMQLLQSSLGVAFVAVLMVIPVSLVVSLLRRHCPRFRGWLALCLYGYAVPGTVLAVGVLILLSWLGVALAEAPIFVVLFVMGFGYLVRFLNVAVQPLQTGYEKIKPELDWAALGLGVDRLRVFTKIHLPLLKPSLVGAMAFVFIEVIKEMPMTLMLRPFGWDTFSVKVYEFTSEGEWQRAALPALLIVLMVSIPSWFVGRGLREERE